MEVKFVEGLRVSDAETVEVAKMVLLGKINSDILVRLNRHGQPAVGLGGEDGALFEVRPVPNPKDVGFVGEIERVNVDVIDHIAEDYVPVIASVATDRDGAPTTSTPTRRQARSPPRCAPTRPSSSPTSTAGCATRTTPTRGSRRRASTRSGRSWTASRAGCGPSSPPASRRSRGGVEAAHIVDGRRPHTLLLELFTDAGIGTKITRVKSLAELQELEARWVMPTYARVPVQFVRGEGARLWDSEGNASTSTSWRESRSARSATAIRGRRGGARAGRHAHPHRRTST